jgi:hypothetical protein
MEYWSGGVMGLGKNDRIAIKKLKRPVLPLNPILQYSNTPTLQ